MPRNASPMAEMPPLADPDLATVGKRLPKGVVCLISAQAFHELTTQIPHVVHVALPRTSRTPISHYATRHLANTTLARQRYHHHNQWG